ncbi:MAG: DUF3874 domain-containing protein [Bacteroidaceae bacterium]|nr:DUF3874 domain-containing protein [Bacteroidaceae bacterium]
MNEIQNESLTLCQQELLPVEVFLQQNYEFRYNILSGKMEFRSRNNHESAFVHLDKKMLNGIVLHARRELPKEKALKQQLSECIYSPRTPDFNPVGEWLDGLPEWDGRNRVAHLFGLLPGLTAEQAYWLTVWLRSMVAHWQQMDMLHGNECVPTLIGDQGCGKSTFCQRLLPAHLREYYLDHVNLHNKFDKEMALTNCLLVNIDEMDQIRRCQQPELKQMLSKSRVNGRIIYGREQTDRLRFASFVATTNNPHPLHDATGSRRFICIRIPKGQLIDNEVLLEYDQLYAQVLHELRRGERYWFTAEETNSIQRANIPYQDTEDIELMFDTCFRQPKTEEYAQALSMPDILKSINHQFPEFTVSQGTKVQLGRVLSRRGFRCKELHSGIAYYVIPLTAA